jgi:uncharacterized protein (TIGR00369 family)
MTDQRILPMDGPNLLNTLGVRRVEATPQRAVSELDFKPELQQLTGLFHAGAILALADSTATLACMRVVDPEGDDLPAGKFPLAVQISANLLRNTGEGTIRATATPVHRGRTMIVVNTVVEDGGGRMLAQVTSTHLVLDR